MGEPQPCFVTRGGARGHEPREARWALCSSRGCRRCLDPCPFDRPGGPNVPCLGGGRSKQHAPGRSHFPHRSASAGGSSGRGDTASPPHRKGSRGGSHPGHGPLPNRAHLRSLCSLQICCRLSGAPSWAQRAHRPSETPWNGAEFTGCAVAVQRLGQSSAISVLTQASSSAARAPSSRSLASVRR